MVTCPSCLQNPLFLPAGLHPDRALGDWLLPLTPEMACDSDLANQNIGFPWKHGLAQGWESDPHLRANEMQWVFP